jgi:hypothetical protein
MNSSLHNPTKQHPLMMLSLRGPILFNEDRVEAAVPPGSIPATTFGWDVVNAISENEINAAWAAAYSGGAAFSFSLGSGITGSGATGKYSIYDGGPAGYQGSGAYLFLSLAVTSAELIQGTAKTTIPAGQLIFQISLEYAPPIPASAPATSAGTTHALTVAWPAATASFTVIDYVVPGGGSLDPVAGALFKAGMGIWLGQQNAAGKLPTLTCASVTVNKSATDFSWLRLTQASYAYLGSDAGGPGALAVLGMAGGASTPGPYHLLAPDAIPSGASAAALIGRETYVREVLLPGAAAIFSGVSVADFELRDGGTSVALKDGVLPSLPRQIVDGRSYDLSATQFSLTVNDQEMITYVEAMTEVSPGVTLYVDATLYTGYKLITKTDGTLTLDYVTIKPSVSTHRIHNSTGAIIGKELLSVILTLVFSIGGALAKELGDKIVLLIIASILKGAIAAATAIIPDILEKGVAEAMPSIDAMLSALESSVAWNAASGKKFTPTDAQLNGSIQIFGDFK